MKYNNKNDLEDIIKDYKQLTLSDMIRVYGLNVVIKTLLEKYPIEQILEFLDIKGIQQFLRKKKLEQIKTKDDV